LLKPETLEFIGRSKIPRGSGTIGYVLASGQPECVESTFSDPRGSVSIEDVLVGNYAWCGIPVSTASAARGKTETGPSVGAVVSFFPVRTDREDPGSASWSHVCGKSFGKDEDQLDSVRNALDRLVNREFYQRLQVLLELENQSSQVDSRPQAAFSEEADLQTGLSKFLDMQQLACAAVCSYSNLLVLHESQDGGDLLLRRADLIRLDITRTALDILRANAFYAVTPGGEEADSALVPTSPIETRFPVPMVHTDVILGSFRVRLRWLGAAPGSASESVHQLFKRWGWLFVLLSGSATGSETKESIRKNKLRRDCATVLFEQIFERAANPETDEKTSNLELTTLNDIVVKQLQLNVSDKKTGSWTLPKGGLDGGAMPDQLLAAELLLDEVGWQITSWGTLKGNQAIHDPIVWKVFQRAAEDPGALKHYKTSLGHSGLTPTRGKDGCFMVQPDKLDVELKNASFSQPLSLRLHPSGCQRAVFEICAGTKTRFQRYDDTIVVTVPQREPHPYCGSYRVIAEESGYVVAFGPESPGCSISNSTDIDLLKSVATKTLRSLFVVEHRRKSRANALRAAVAAIMARNMSHNIGSHVLNQFDSGRYRGTDVGTSANRQFTSYLAQRMDFIAGVTSNWVGTPETVWFLADVLERFILNRHLIDTIIKSHDFDGTNISFVVKRRWEVLARPPGSKHAEAPQWYELDEKLSRRAGLESRPEDFQVAVPRGSVGCHAFFTILENILRNAAKYGARENASPLRLFIDCDLDADKGAYLLSVYDNLSPACREDSAGKKRDVVKEMNQHISRPVVEPKSLKPESTAMGVAEMKESAKFLVQPRTDRIWVHSGDGGPHYIWARKLEREHVGVEKREYLCYQFYLQVARNLFVVTDSSEFLPAQLGVFGASGIDALRNADQSYSVNVVPDSNALPPGWKRWWRPYRQVERASVLQGAARYPDSGDTRGWREFTLKAYRCWLDSWRPVRGDKPAPYHLVIGIADDDREAVLKAGWGKANFPKLLERLTPRLAGVHVIHTKSRQILKVIGSAMLAKGGGTRRVINGEEFCEDVLCDKDAPKLLLYDNHNNLLGLLGEDAAKARVAFHQPLGIKYRGYKSYSLLETPPQDEFHVENLLMSLYEAALTRVLVIDERVAESLLDSTGNLDGDRRKEMERAGICVPFYLMFDGTPDPVFVSKRLEVLFEERLGECVGVRVDRDWRIIPGPNGIAGESDMFDIAVVHQGVVDERIPSVQDGWYVALDASVRHIVMTSGRGRYTKTIPIDGDPKELPFLEFSGIHENLVEEVSKYHLVRALASAKGGPDG
jgi:hypothetical protein